MRSGRAAGARWVVGRLAAHQKVRFVLVGAVNTVVGYSIFALLFTFVLAEVRLGYLLSLIGSYAISIIMAFFLYRRFVFDAVGRVARDFVAFVGVNLFAIGTNVVLLVVLVELVGIPPYLAQALSLVCTTLISFFGHREISFRRLPEDVPPVTPSPTACD